MKGFSLCFSGFTSTSDSQDESTETHMLKFCEPSPGQPSNAKSDTASQTLKSCETSPEKPGNAKSDSTFQVYKVSSAIKPFPCLINTSEFVMVTYLCVYSVVIKEYCKSNVHMNCAFQEVLGEFFI